MYTISELKWILENKMKEKNYFQFLLDNKMIHYSIDRGDYIEKIKKIECDIDKILSELSKENNNQIKFDFILYYECEDCNNLFIIDNDDILKNLKNKYGKIICDDCKDNYIFCDDCSDVLNKDDDGYYNDNSNRICEACYDNYIYCESCDNTIHVDNSEYYEGRYYCQECFNQKYVYCHECNTVIEMTYAYYSDRTEEYYCEHCYPSNSDYEEFNATSINLMNNTFNTIKSTRKFGIELELSYDDIDYSSISNYTCFGSKEDCSINTGAELYSPILQGDKGYNEIKKLCEIIENYDNDDSAGCHLHIDFTNEINNSKALRNVYYLYLRIENIIYKVINPDRINSTYSKPSKVLATDIYDTESYNDIINLYNNKNKSRYYGINLGALNRYNTIELRYREGLNKFDDIINWIKLNLYLFDYALKNDIVKLKNITSNINSLDKFITFIGIISHKDYNLINYWIIQFNKYNSIEENKIDYSAKNYNSGARL